MVWVDIIGGMGQRPSGSGASRRTREAINAAAPSKFDRIPEWDLLPEWELPLNPDLIPPAYTPAPDTIEMLPTFDRTPEWDLLPGRELPLYTPAPDTIELLPPTPEYQGLPFGMMPGLNEEARREAFGEIQARQLREEQQLNQLGMAGDYELSFSQFDILDPAERQIFVDYYEEYRKDLIYASRPPGLEEMAKEKYEPGTVVNWVGSVPTYRIQPSYIPGSEAPYYSPTVYVADEHGVLQRQERDSTWEAVKVGLERLGPIYDWPQRNIGGPLAQAAKETLFSIPFYDWKKGELTDLDKPVWEGWSTEPFKDLPENLVTHYKELRADNQAFIEDESKPWAMRAIYDGATNLASYLPLGVGGKLAAKLPASMKALKIPLVITGEIIDEGGPLFAIAARVGGEGAVRYQEDIPVLKHMDPMAAGLLGALVVGGAGALSPRIATGAYKWTIKPEVRRQFVNGIEQFSTSAEAWKTAVADSPYKAMVWVASQEGQDALTTAGVKFADVGSAILPKAIQAVKEAPAYAAVTWAIADEVVKYNLGMTILGRPLKQGENFWAAIGDQVTRQGLQEYVGNAYLSAGVAVEMAMKSPGIMWDAVRTAVDERLMTPQRGAQIIADALGDSADATPFLRSIIPDEVGDGAIHNARQRNTADAFNDVPVNSNGQPSPYISMIRDALSAGEEGQILNPAWTAWQGMQRGAETINGVVINPMMEFGSGLRDAFNLGPKADWNRRIDLYEGRKNKYLTLLDRQGYRPGNETLREFGIGERLGNTQFLGNARDWILPVFNKIHARADGFDPNDARFALNPEQEVIYDMARGLSRWEEEATFAGVPGFKTHIARGSEPFNGVYFPRDWQRIYMNPEEVTRWVADAGLGGNQRTVGGGTTSSPGFTKPRGNETFEEMVTNVFRVEDVDDPRIGQYFRHEPLSWNPFDMLLFRAAEGVNYREQMALLRELQQMKMPDGTPIVREFKEWVIDQRTGNETLVPSALIEEGWRIPKVDAFLAQGVTAIKFGWEGWQQFPKAVPNEVATMLELAWPPTKSAGAWEKFQELSTFTKRLKLVGSFFQNFDFGTRGLAIMWAGAADDAIHLQPREMARKMLLSYPKAAAVFTRGWLPEWSGLGKKKMWDDMLSGDPIFTAENLVKRYGWDPDRAAEVAPQLTTMNLIEHGLSTADASLVDRSIQRDLQRLAVQAMGNAGPMDSIRMSRGMKNLLQLQKYMEEGLFGGTYPALSILATKEFFLPRLLRQYKNADADKLLFEAADLANIASSTLRNSQSVMAKSPGMQSFMHAIIFSTNETESLLRQFFGMVAGTNKRTWGLYNVGAYVSLMVSANLINWFATVADAGFDFSEGEFLPMADWLPIQSNEHSPLGISYNSGFAAPQAPFIGGRNDTELDLDLVGQLDTAFRILDGADFIRARVNVIPRAALNQAGGEDFWGRDLGDGPDLTAWAPGQSDFGSRLYQALVDVGAPIFFANTMEAARQALGFEDAYPEAEGRVGVMGNLIQALGLNVRGEPTRDFLTRMSSQFPRDPDDEDQTPYNYYATYGEPGFMKRTVREEFKKSPQVAAEMQARKETGADRGNEWSIYQLTTDEQRDGWHEAQVADDQALINKEISEEEWRKRRTARIHDASVITQVTRDLLLDLDQDRGVAFEDMDPVGQWVAMKEENTTFDGQVDWDAIDAWLYSQDLDFRDYVFEEMGLNNTPMELEYRQAMRSISENRTEKGLSYWDMRQVAFDEFLASKGISAYGISTLEMVGPNAALKRMSEGEHATAKRQEFFSDANDFMMRKFGSNWKTKELANGGTVLMVADAFVNWQLQGYFLPLNRMIGDLHSEWLDRTIQPELTPNKETDVMEPNPKHDPEIFDDGYTMGLLQKWGIGALSEVRVRQTFNKALLEAILENPELEAPLTDARFTQ